MVALDFLQLLQHGLTGLDRNGAPWMKAAAGWHIQRALRLVCQAHAFPPTVDARLNVNTCDANWRVDHKVTSILYQT